MKYFDSLLGGKDFFVKEIPNKGRGLFSKTKFLAGTVLFDEQPVISIPIKVIF